MVIGNQARGIDTDCKFEIKTFFLRFYNCRIYSNRQLKKRAEYLDSGSTAGMTSLVNDHV
jgi:hypothetical protein